ncbi:glycosyltransferase family 2 protein [Fibrobacterota bacterium]
MNCLNSGKYVKEAIDSVYAQTFSEWEIIFWDTVSVDNSPEIAKSYDGKLRYFRGEETVPLYAARNLALEQARGKYIAILDCDDMWLPEKLELQVEKFKGNKALGLVHTNVEILEHTGSTRVLHRKPQPQGRVFKNILKNYCINLQTAMISRQVLDGLSCWFDDGMQYSGDADLFLRIAYDWEVGYIPAVTARYREHGGSLSAQKIENILKESPVILRKFAEEHKNFNFDHKKEIKSFKRKVILAVVMAKWKYSNGTEVRKAIREIIPLSALSIVIYFLSYLPYRLIAFLRYRSHF